VEQVPKLMTALGLKQGELLRAATGPPGEDETHFTALLEQLSTLLSAESAPGDQKLPAEPNPKAETAVDLPDLQGSILLLASLGGLIQGNPELLQQLSPETQEALQDGLLDLSSALTPERAALTGPTAGKQLRTVEPSVSGTPAQTAPEEASVEAGSTEAGTSPTEGTLLPNQSAGKGTEPQEAASVSAGNPLPDSRDHPALSPAGPGGPAGQADRTTVQKGQQHAQGPRLENQSPTEPTAGAQDQAGRGPERASQQPSDPSQGHQSQAAGNQQPVEPAKPGQPEFNQAGLQSGAAGAKNPSGREPAVSESQIHQENQGAESEPQPSGPNPAPAALPDLKTAQAGRTEQPAAAAPVRELPQTILRMIENGEDHLKLQLRPSRMGEMEIDISRGEQGLSIALRTESESTAQLLKGHLDELKSSLARSGVQLHDLSVNQGSQQEAHSYRQPNRPAAAHPDQAAEQETTSPPLHYHEGNSVEYLI